jgi:hypothetical protein
MDPLGYSSGKYGGSVREAGGAFGAREAAREEVYFRQQDEQKLADLRRAIDDRQKSSQQNDSKNTNCDKSNSKN